jgi:hypothetical protein
MKRKGDHLIDVVGLRRRRNDKGALFCALNDKISQFLSLRDKIRFWLTNQKDAPMYTVVEKGIVHLLNATWSFNNFAGNQWSWEYREPNCVAFNTNLGMNNRRLCFLLSLAPQEMRWYARAENGHLKVIDYAIPMKFLLPEDSYLNTHLDYLQQRCYECLHHFSTLFCCSAMFILGSETKPQL